MKTYGKIIVAIALATLPFTVSTGRAQTDCDGQDCMPAKEQPAEDCDGQNCGARTDAPAVDCKGQDCDPIAAEQPLPKPQ